MTVEEYIHLLHEAFPEKYFASYDSFNFSKGAIEDGLNRIEENCVEGEVLIEENHLFPSEVQHLLRQTQAIANILKISLREFSLKKK